MNNEEIENENKISSKILEKIQELNKITEIGFCQFPKQKILEKNIIENINKNSFIFDINNEIKLISENKIDNSDFVSTHLESSYNGKYLIYLFSRNYKNTRFQKSQIYENADFNVKQCMEIAKTARCWLSIDKENKIIFVVQKNKEPELMFLISSILSFCKYFGSAKLAFENIKNISFFQKFQKHKIIQRYVNYFDKISEIKSFSKLILNQLIITTIPTIIDSNEYKPILEIKSNERVLVIDNGNFYKDSDFVIFSGINQELSEEVKISIFFEKENTKYHVFDLKFNSLFYEQGLFRFTREEINTTLPLEDIYKYFNSDFSLDLIFVSNSDLRLENPYYYKMDLIEDIISISSRMPIRHDQIIFDKLLSLSFNRAIAKFCSKMYLNLDQSYNLVSNLESKGYNNLIYIPNPLQTNILQPSQDIKKDKIICNPILNENENFLYSEIDPIGIVEISKIVEKENKAPYSLLKNRSFIRKKSIKNDSELLAIKPLHWSSVWNIEGSVFELIKNFNVKIDCTLFEDKFCKNKNKIDKKTIKIEKIKTICDSKRLFLISLNLKHLEHKKIFPESISKIIDFESKRLSIQDLNNIESVFPNEKEQILFEKAKIDNLSDIEKIMFRYYKFKNILPKIRILKFEREFFEEYFSEEKYLIEFDQILIFLIESKNLKILIKILLEIGNLINDKYSFQRKFSDGFKLESLSIFSSYSNNGYQLITLITKVLIENDINLAYFVEEFKILEKYKLIDLKLILENLNLLIEKYNIVFKEYENLLENDKLKYFNLFAFSSQKLKSISDLFNIVKEHSNSLQRYLCDDTSKPIGETIEILYNFIIKLEK